MANPTVNPQAPTNLSSYYQSQGKQLGATAEQRFADPAFAAAAQAAGFTPQSYKVNMGNAAANEAILAHLQKGTKPAQQAPQQPAAQPQQQQPATTTQPQPPQDQLGQYTQGLTQEQSQSDAAYNSLQNTLGQLQTGTLQLNPEEKQYMDAMNASAARARQISMEASAAQTGLTKEAMARSGATQTSPQAAAAEISATVQEGANKMIDIDSKANLAIAQFQQGVRQGRISDARQAYADFEDMQKQKMQALTETYKAVTDHEKDIRDFNYQVQKDKADMALKQQELKVKEQAAAGQAEARQALVSSRWNMDIKRATDAYVNPTKNPTAKMVIGAAPMLQKIEAAKNIPGSVSDQDLLDSVTMLNTGGNRVTEAQVGLITQGRSFADAANVFKKKLGAGGVLSDSQRKQLVDLGEAVYKNYQKAYKPLYDSAVSAAKAQGIPDQYLQTIPSPETLSQVGGFNDTTNAGSLQSIYSGADPAQQASIEKMITDNPDLTPDELLQVMGADSSDIINQ